MNWQRVLGIAALAVLVASVWAMFASKATIGVEDSLYQAKVAAPVWALAIFVVSGVVSVVFWIWGSRVPHELAVTDSKGAEVCPLISSRASIPIPEHQESKIVADVSGSVASWRNLRDHGYIDTIDGAVLFRKKILELESGSTLRWLDTFCPKHIGPDDLSALAGKGVKILLLVQDECENATYRSKEIEVRYRRIYLNSLKSFRENILEYQTSSGGGVPGCSVKDLSISRNLHVYAYKNLPCMPMYIVTPSSSEIAKGKKEIAYHSHFLRRATVDGKHLVVGGLGIERLKEYFDDKFLEAVKEEYSRGLGDEGEIKSYG